MTLPPRLFVVASFVVACSAHVDRLPDSGETLAARHLVVEPGGKGFNLAVAARRLGAEVDGLLAVGDDPFAVLAAPALERAGLPRGMIRSYAGPTGGGIGFTDSAGRNCLAVALGANARLDADSVLACAAMIESSAMTLAPFEIGDAPIRAAFRLARAAGRETLLNPSPARPIPDDILADTSILVANTIEAEALGRQMDLAASTAPEAVASALLGRGPRLVAITEGAEGASLFAADGTVTRCPAFPAATVDPLGCGDAFTAGLAVSLAEGLGLAESLRFGCACGALVAEQAGVFAALPERAAVERLLAAG